MSDDDKSLLDPTHPRSPHNKYNWDSPNSVHNPLSPHYDPHFYDGLFDGSKESAIAVVLGFIGGPLIVTVAVFLLFVVTTVLTTPVLLQVCIYGGPLLVGFGLHRLCRADDNRTGRSDTGWYMSSYWIIVVVAAMIYIWS